MAIKDTIKNTKDDVLDSIDDAFNNQYYNNDSKNPKVILFAESFRTPFVISGAKVNITKSNDVKSTTLVGRRGSVKELIQAKDYAVTIEGTLIGAEQKFPYAELALLNKVLNEPKSILVASNYLAMFGIFRLAFKSTEFKVTDARDSVNTLPYTLVFESDYTYDFKLSEN